MQGLQSEFIQIFYRGLKCMHFSTSKYSGAPNDGFLPNALKRCFRLSGVLLRTVCRKDRLTVYKIEKIDFLKICQNKGLGKLVHKIYLLDRLEVYLFFDEFFSFCPWKPAKFTPKSALL